MSSFYTVEATQGLSVEDRYASIVFLLDCAERGEIRGKQRRRRPPSICKVSRSLRDDNESSYEPQLVSIGPIHREDPKLQEFEWLKECYLNDLLSRCKYSTPKETLEACLLEVNTLIPKIRESYAGVKKNYSDVELARMMVMDGCFILEFCFKHQNEYSDLPNDMQTVRIAMDLILLENQIPFVVLQALFDCLAPITVTRKGPVTLSQILDDYLAHIYINLFHSQLPLQQNVRRAARRQNPDVDHDHILGYLHTRYQLVAAESSKPKHAEASKLVDEEQAKSSNPKHAEASKKPPFFLNAPRPKKLCSSFCKNFRKCTLSNCVMAPSLHAEASKHVDEGRIMHTAFHSIVELYRSGINLKPHQEGDRSMTIKFQSPRFSCLPLFWGKPTLLMPTLFIGDFTELILRNFIAYEQSFRHLRYYFTSYAYAMDMLIDTQEDIAKLVESKVLVNMLGSNQEAADMINKLCKNIIIPDFYYYNQEFKQVDKYYNRFWPKNIAKLRRIYFSNPWSAIVLLAALILFGLTVVSTIFTVLQYFG